jgi:hypothetical protein
VLLHPIRRRKIAEPDRAAVQDRVIMAVEANPERFLAAYVGHPESFGGRYVCADLMKETIPDYAASREARGRFNAAVHNAAAVLAAEQFHRAVADAARSGGGSAVFLTGMPGSGKTSLVLTGGMLPGNVRVLFEGQLVDRETSLQKVGNAIEAGLVVGVEAILAKPEDALDNTFKRFEELGRGAAISVMARIQEGTPGGLRVLMHSFGDRMTLFVHDVRDRSNVVTYPANHGISVWEEELANGSVGKRLTDHLGRLRAAGSLSDACYRQAIGLAPYA